MLTIKRSDDCPLPQERLKDNGMYIAIRRAIERTRCQNKYLWEMLCTDREKEVFLDMLIVAVLQEEMLNAAEAYTVGFFDGTTLAKDVN